MRRPITSIAAAIVLGLSALTIAACEDDGALEEAGENADEAIDDAQDEVEDATN